MYFFIFIVCGNTRTSMISTNFFFDFTDFQALLPCHAKQHEMVEHLQKHGHVLRPQSFQRSTRVQARVVTSDCAHVFEQSCAHGRDTPVVPRHNKQHAPWWRSRRTIVATSGVSVRPCIPHRPARHLGQYFTVFYSIFHLCTNTFVLFK